MPEHPLPMSLPSFLRLLDPQAVLVRASHDPGRAPGSLRELTDTSPELFLDDPRLLGVAERSCTTHPVLVRLDPFLGDPAPGADLCFSLGRTGDVAVLRAWCVGDLPQGVLDPRVRRTAHHLSHRPAHGDVLSDEELTFLSSASSLTAPVGVISWDASSGLVLDLDPELVLAATLAAHSLYWSPPNAG